MHADTLLSPDELRALWHELADDDTRVEPYELTEHGEIVVSPRPTNRHQVVASMVARELERQLGGLAVTEAAVLTATVGIRVPDVVWMPTERWSALAASELLQTPDLVGEVLSPRNRKAEVAHKVRAYLACGIGEVIVVRTNGTIEFHRHDGVHASSSRSIQFQLPPELFA